MVHAFPMAGTITAGEGVAGQMLAAVHLQESSTFGCVCLLEGQLMCLDDYRRFVAWIAPKIGHAIRLTERDGTSRRSLNVLHVTRSSTLGLLLLAASYQSRLSRPCRLLHLTGLPLPRNSFQHACGTRSHARHCIEARLRRTPASKGARPPALF